MKFILTACSLLFLFTGINAQLNTAKFGKGIIIEGADSSYYLKLGFRFQNLFVSSWNLEEDKFSGLSDYEAAFLIRRARLKFDGWAYSPKLSYKLELGLSNRDISGGSSPEFNNTANIILDAYIEWNFYKNLVLKFGQAKLPGNRERVISSANLQFVDRSLLNSRFNIDRDFGFQLKNEHSLFGSFIMREIIALSQGEGRNVTGGYFGGVGLTYRLEFLPFGKFISNGDYVGSALVKESTPKLSLGLSYDNNNHAVRERGQLGNFIKDDAGNYFGKDLNTIFADLMFKYQSWSIMSEFANRSTPDDDPMVRDTDGAVIGQYFTGSAFNIQVGYLFPKDWEIAGRYTSIAPDDVVGNNIDNYTLGISKYIVGHKLKIQSDITLSQKEATDDELIWRTQMDIHF